MTREQTIEKYVEKYNLTLEEATTLYEQDESGWENPELKDAKPRKRRYVQNQPRKTTKKERKVDNDKLAIWQKIVPCLKNELDIDGHLNNEVSLDFEYLDKSYTLKLTLHRKKTPK